MRLASRSNASRTAVRVSCAIFSRSAATNVAANSRASSTLAAPGPLRPEQGLLRIRKGLGLFANLRPALVYPELVNASSLKPELVSGLDIMILRELTGDIYFGQPRGIRTLDNGEQQGFDTMHYSESEVRRVAHVGFQIAMKRGKKLCSVDKANVLDTSMFWRED